MAAVADAYLYHREVQLFGKAHCVCIQLKTKIRTFFHRNGLDYLATHVRVSIKATSEVAPSPMMTKAISRSRCSGDGW